MAKAVTPTAPADDDKNLPTAASGAVGAVSADLAMADSMAEFAGLGTENVSAADLLVPRLAILQALSPQLKRNKAEFIPDAEVGDIADVGLGEVLGGPENPIHFLPVYYRRDYLEWAPRESGKGLVNVHPDPSILDQTRPNEKNKPVLPNGNLIAETAQFFGFIISEDGSDYRPAFIPMTSTQLKKARKWLTLSDKQKIPGANYKPPLFWAVYKLGSAPEDNTQGDWMGWTINVKAPLPQFAPDNWQEIMRQCRKLLESVRSGETRGDMAGMDGAEGGVVIDGDTI